MKRAIGNLAVQMAQATGLDGVFAINKPMGMSSAQVIRDCQSYFNPSRLFKPALEREEEERRAQAARDRKRRSKAKQKVQVKMGHGGTLDPLATGVLILGVGRGTKSLQNFLECTKTYETVVLFGASTDTYDRVGRILQRRSYDDVTRDKVEAALASFRGRYRQMPPLYSALKMNGKPLYEYAREGKPIPREIETREVEVTDLELVEWYEPGSHPHRWPIEEAGIAEKSLAERVWTAEQEQATGKKLTPEQEQEEDRAFAAHQSFKEMAEERQDMLIFDKQTGRKRKADGSDQPLSKKQMKREQRAAQRGAGHQRPEPMMSGALGELPPGGPPKGRGSDLIPKPPAPDAPPPWSDKGPPACRVRMTVTSGFYVRSFCHELGEKVGSAAMMAELERSRQGDYVLGKDNCIEYDVLAKGESVWGPQVERILHTWSSTHLPNVGALKSIYGDAEAVKSEISNPTTTVEAEAVDASKNGVTRDDKEWNGISDAAAPTEIKAEEKAAS
ncbi:hypothetical protein RB595_008770 [Gaeumannomyces hyphopodioides]